MHGQEMAMTSGQVRLSAALGGYPQIEKLRSGEIASDKLTLDFAAVSPISRAFAPMVRRGEYDVGELAIATFLQAKAYGKPLVLLPIVVAARFQEAALLCLSDSDIAGPADLAGRRVGVRAYSQTTGVWLRGVLAEFHGVTPEQIRWITFEDAHVAEYRDPPFVERAAADKELVAMLRAREVDAIIVGNDPPADPAFRAVFADPKAAADVFWARHHLVPINHLVTVRQSLAEERPDLIRDLIDMFGRAKAALPEQTDGRDRLPIGRAAVAPAVALALRYAAEQQMLPRALTLDEVWGGLPGDIG
jgi:4,5-dihydroxyphthalate decarboxylase